MQIWVDADACPYEIKEMLFRAAERGQVQVTLVANQILRTPPSPWINPLLVSGGMNIADRRIVELVSPGCAAEDSTPVRTAACWSRHFFKRDRNGGRQDWLVGKCTASRPFRNPARTSRAILTRLRTPRPF